MIDPTEDDVAALADAIGRTARQLADRRRSNPEFAARVEDLLAHGEKHANELGFPEVGKALRSDS